MICWFVQLEGNLFFIANFIYISVIIVVPSMHSSKIQISKLPSLSFNFCIIRISIHLFFSRIKISFWWWIKFVVVFLFKYELKFMSLKWKRSAEGNFLWMFKFLILYIFCWHQHLQIYFREIIKLDNHFAEISMNCEFELHIT